MLCVSLAECEIPDLQSTVGVSPYWRMSDEEREVRREYSRRRYQDPVIRERMKRHQYLKCLKSGLIQKPSARTLSRHGIAVRDGEYSFVQ